MGSQGRLKPCVINSTQRAAMHAAQQDLARYFSQGNTPEQHAQVLAALSMPHKPRQPQLDLKVRE